MKATSMLALLSLSIFIAFGCGLAAGIGLMMAASADQYVDWVREIDAMDVPDVAVGNRNAHQPDLTMIGPIDDCA